jgi:RES domain-containing protein
MFPPRKKPTGGVAVTDPDQIAMLEEMFPDAETRPKDEVTDPAEVLDELGGLFNRNDLFYTLSAGTLLFRVRIHAPEKRPDNTMAALGPPGAEDARFSNRMSPAGVPMFYAAFDEATAIAETAVWHDGMPAERTTGTFRVLKDLIVLDLVNLPGVPSIFHGDQANLDRPALSFLHDFVQDLTKPIEKRRSRARGIRSRTDRHRVCQIQIAGKGREGGRWHPIPQRAQA